jgi:chromosome segregation ATPase
MMNVLHVLASDATISDGNIAWVIAALTTVGTMAGGAYGWLQKAKGDRQKAESDAEKDRLNYEYERYKRQIADADEEKKKVVALYEGMVNRIRQEHEQDRTDLRALAKEHAECKVLTATLQERLTEHEARLTRQNDRIREQDARIKALEDRSPQRP